MKKTAIALLAAALALQATADVQLLPVGEFVGRDGRPTDEGLTWKLPDEQGRKVAAWLNARHKYRVVQHHLNEFIRHFRWALASRELLPWLKATPPATLTDNSAQRASSTCSA